uniref:Uncharacterized protein n=1 Tax=Glossina austeni TaxID=7395 RepID=A0A1A9UQV6_GLOAU
MKLDYRHLLEYIRPGAGTQNCLSGDVLGGEEVNGKGMNDMSIKAGGSSEMAIAQVLCKINSFTSLLTSRKDLQKCFQNIPGAIILHETIVRDNVGFNFYKQRLFKSPFEDLEATKRIIALTAALGAI